MSKIVIEYGKVARQPKNEDATPEAVKSFADTILALGTSQDVFGADLQESFDDTMRALESSQDGFGPDLQEDGSVGDSDEEYMTTDEDSYGEANAFLD